MACLIRSPPHWKRSFRPPSAQASGRAGAIELSPHERTAATVDFFLAMAGAGEANRRRASAWNKRTRPAWFRCCATNTRKRSPWRSPDFLPRDGQVLAFLSADVRSIVRGGSPRPRWRTNKQSATLKSCWPFVWRALLRPRFASIDGVAVLGEILQSLDRKREHEIITGLAHDEPHLAEAVA